MSEALVHPVADRAVVVEAGKHLLHLVQHLVDAHHIEEGFLLTRKAGIGQVFGGSRRAHGERCARVSGSQSLEVAANRLIQISRERRLLDPLANLCTRLAQGPNIVGVQRGQTLFDPRGQPVMGQKAPERMRGGREPARHPHTGGSQLADHFAERGVLAAHRLDVGHPQVFKGYDQGGRQILG